MPEPSILLRERARLQPDDTVFTFTDYEQDWAGVADKLRRHGSAGDRAVILAPQSLEYVVDA